MHLKTKQQNIAATFQKKTEFKRKLDAIHAKNNFYQINSCMICKHNVTCLAEEVIISLPQNLDF